MIAHFDDGTFSDKESSKLFRNSRVSHQQTFSVSRKACVAVTLTKLFFYSLY